MFYDDSIIKAEYFSQEDEMNLMSVVEHAGSFLTSLSDWSNFDSNGHFDKSSYKYWHIPLSYMGEFWLVQCDFNIGLRSSYKMKAWYINIEVNIDFKSSNLTNDVIQIS